MNRSEPFLRMTVELYFSQIVSYSLFQCISFTLHYFYMMFKISSGNKAFVRLSATG